MAAQQKPGFIRALSRTRFATRAVMVFERLWPLLLPLLVVAGLYLITAWFGIFRIVPDTARLAIAGAFALAAIAALALLLRLRAPTTAEVNRRIEANNALTHEPVTVQDEGLSVPGDAFAEALWHEHRRRMAARLRDLDAGLPKTGVPARDPWGLRAAVALLLVIAFAWSWGPQGGRIADPLTSHAAIDAIPPRIDAWITPPAYTGRAPIFLTSEANRTQTAFAVPEASALTLRIIGGDGTEKLEFTTGAGSVVPLPDKAGQIAAEAPGAAPLREFDYTLGETGTVSLGSGDTPVAEWQFTVLPDNAPTVAMIGEPQRAVNGTLTLQYTIDDDYGAVSAQTGFALLEDGGEHARPLYEAPEMPLSLPRRRADPPAARTSRDLTVHPWAGLAVEMELTATDAAGQTGSSEPYRMRLPERIFTNPLAKAVVEQRRILALDANMARDILAMLDAIMLRPEDTIPSSTNFLALTSLRTRLSLAETDDSLRDVVDYMWQVALGIEDGDLSAAEQRLRQAQEALEDALERGASDEEIEQLMAELREAIDEFMREMAEQAMRNQDFAQNMPPNSQEMTQLDLDRMLDQIEDMAKSGSRDKAQEMLDQLRQMMDNLRMAQRQQGQQGQGQSAMRQQMDQLGELMRRQQELMNETFRLDQMQRDLQQRGDGNRNGDQPQQGQNGQQGQQGQPGQQGQQGQRQGNQPGQGMTAEELAEALRELQEAQRGLQGDLEALQRGLEGLGMQPSEDFGEAGRQMGQAEGNLGQGRGSAAVDNQGDALDALRRGAQDMMSQMQQALQQQQGDGEGQGDPNGTRNAGDRDPLGRPRATNGPDFGDSVDVPDEIDVQRAREILEAIRRRLGDALSPDLEKDYLERLLEMR